MIRTILRHRHLRAPAALLAAALGTLLLLACGSGGSSPTEPQAVAPPPPAPATPPTTGQTVDFEGRVTASSASGRRLELAAGPVVVLRANTAFDPTGDLFGAGQIAAAVASGSIVRVEGAGVRRNDGSVRALAIKAETDD